MKTSFPRVVLALFALSFIVAACASESGTTWTFAPTSTSDATDSETPLEPTEPTEPEEATTPAEPTEPTEPAEPAESAEPGLTEPTEPTEPEATEPTEPEATEPTEPTEPTAPAEPADVPASGEPRVIELEADAAIRFMQDGEQIRDIAVTPGETIVFRIDNTAGFVHNFYIGPDSDLSVPSSSTEVGIPDWETGVQELEWVVPEDLTDLRFACTVPGHYYTMQGDFTITP